MRSLLELAALAILCLWGLLCITIVVAAAVMLLDVGGWWARLRGSSTRTTMDTLAGRAEACMCLGAGCELCAGAGFVVVLHEDPVR